MSTASIIKTERPYFDWNDYFILKYEKLKNDCKETEDEFIEREWHLSDNRDELD
jgi:hypothetical protein